MNGAEIHITNNLATRIAHGDQLAFSDAHELYKARLFFYAKRFSLEWHEVEDIVADAFLALWKGREQLQSDIHLQNFLFFAVRNKALNRIQSRQKQNEIYKKWWEQHADGETPFDDDAVAPELMQLLYQAAQTLPNDYRRIFELSYYHEKTPQEIAQLLHANPATIRSQKRRAIHMLREWIRQHTLIFLLLILFPLNEASEYKTTESYRLSINYLNPIFCYKISTQKKYSFFRHAGHIPRYILFNNA